MMRPIKLITALFTALLLSMVCISCSEKDEKDAIPEMPPVDALLMDFSQFIENPDQGTGLKSMETYENAVYSYLTASYWNIMISVPMIIPVAAYLESFNHTPVYLGENSWQWSYTVGSGLETYTARLVTTRISNEKFTAEMFVTKVGSFEDFKWFEGTIRYDRTHAAWTMYESAANNVAWLQIDWNMDWEKETSNITYTIVKSGHEEQGSYLDFGITEDSDYNAYYTISHSQKETIINWNLTSMVGRVKDDLNFGDTDWHCWNELYQDVNCN